MLSSRMEQESEGQAAKMRILEFERKVRMEALSGCQQIKNLENLIRDAPEGGLLGVTNGEDAKALRTAILKASATVVEKFSKVIRLLSTAERSPKSMPMGGSKAQEQLAAKAGALSLDPDNSLLSSEGSHMAGQMEFCSPNASPCHTPHSGSGMSEGIPGRQNQVALDSDADIGGNPALRRPHDSASADPELNEKPVLPKKRKYLPKYQTKQRAIGTGDPAKDAPPDDGYTWRKYGQKDIKESAYPRSYYICTHKTDLGCPSKKWVQLSDDDPNYYDVTYHGHHICQSVEQRTWDFGLAPSHIAIHELLTSDPKGPSSSALMLGARPLLLGTPGQSQENVIIGTGHGPTQFPAHKSTSGLTVSQSLPHITSLEEKIPEQTYSRGTEAESTCIKRTKKESYHEEGETNDTSRAHPQNQTTSGAIEHMTFLFKQNDVTMDPIRQTKSDSGEPLLSDLNRSTTAAPNSEDVPQSPHNIASLQGDSGENIPEHPLSSTWETEAGKTSECAEEGEMTEAHQGNLTTSGEIKDMTTSTKLEDRAMDPVEKSDEASSSAQVESMPVNLMDLRNSTQRDLLVASTTSLRSDVLALGFKSFHDEFDPERILCIYNVSQDALEILFFHVKGMAMLFGAGLSFSSLLLTKDGVEDGVLEVKELQPLVWMNRWSISEMSDFSPLLFNSSTLSTQPSGFASTPRDTVLSFSPKQAAELFGVGLEGGPSYFIRMPLSEFHHEVSNVTAISPSWIASLFRFLSCRGHAGSDGQATDMRSGHIHGSPFTTKDLSLPSSSGSTPGTTLHENNPRSQGQESPEVTAIERGMQIQPRQLTVIIRLDPENCTFRDTESNIPLVNPIDVDPALRKFFMVPEVTIRFLYDPRLRGRGSKKMTTTLDVNFLIKGTVSGDPEKFGWYHDQLRLSFKCKQRGEVARVSRENEIVSDHEIRTADSGYTRASSITALDGKGREQQWSIGYRPIGGAQFSASSRQENTVGNSENHEVSTRISAVCLKKANFSIQKLEGLSELAYRAAFFPSLHLYNVWNWIDRDHLQISGIMSAVSVKIEGDWEVMRDDEDMQGSSDSGQGNRTSFCKYEFSCKRELNLLRSQISQRGRVLLSNSPNAEPELSVDTVQRLIEKHLQQKLVCGFIINHSFSHMPRLERPDPYVWNMVGGPCPRPADEILGAELQE